MKKITAVVILLIITALFTISCSPKMLIVKPSPASQDIVLEGRFEYTAEGARFDWPLSAINASFTGSSARIDMEPNGNEFNLYIDGVFKEAVSSFP